jgi:hypothetical protein
MRTLVDQKVTDQGYRFSKFKNEEGKISFSMQFLAEAEIINVNDTTPAGTNSNGNAFYVANVKITEKGMEQKATAIIWENQLKSEKLSEGTWGAGAPIMLAINAEKGQPHYGKASIELRSGATGVDTNTLPAMDEATLEAMKAMGMENVSISA